MKQKLALAFGVAAIVIGMTYGARSVSAGEDHKVLICHVTGNGKAHVIDIDLSAWPAHQAHGDSMDVAPGSKPGEPCDPTLVLK